MSRLENVQILQDSFGAIAKNSQMRFKWALYVILSNDYDTQRNLLPSNNLGNLREILNQMGKKGIVTYRISEDKEKVYFVKK